MSMSEWRFSRFFSTMHSTPTRSRDVEEEIRLTYKALRRRGLLAQ